MDQLTRVKFTNLDKVLYPMLEVKKSQVIEHYIRMAPRMLSFLEGRAVVLNRYPDGVDHEGFYEKDAPRGTPDWVDTFTRYSEAAEREIDYVLCNNLDTLLWLANLAALELHVTLSRAASFENPDLVLFDLDPEPPFGFHEATDVGLLLKEKLDALGYESYAKTSGKKGLHVLMPIAGEHLFRQTREFVHGLGKRLASENEMVVSEVSQSRDPAKVYIDYPQNSKGRTMICPYSLRAEQGATVSTPLEWRELKGTRPEELNIFSVSKRKIDPWEGFWEHKQRLEA